MSEERGEPLPQQPGLMKLDRWIVIRNIGLFRRRTGQPIHLRAFPHVRQAGVTSVKGKLQAYRGQDHYDPTYTYTRGTRRERLQALAAGQQAPIAQRTQGADADPAQILDLQWHAGEDLIQRRDQPWAGNAGREVDYNMLEECDRLTMETIRKSGLLSRVKGGFNPVTPSYLTVLLPGDMAMLTAQKAMELSVAFLYSRGCRQLPLGERVLVNDLYGTPLYQPSVGHLELGQQSGAQAAAAIIDAMGAICLGPHCNVHQESSSV